MSENGKIGKVFVNLGMSLDGFVAGPNRGPKNPLGDKGLSLHEWLFKQDAFRQHLHLGPGGETGPDNHRVARTFERIGANIMGKRMFDEGEANWPEDAPFDVPVFVLTKTVRSPWVRGKTTFYFVNENLESVLAKARAIAGARDVRISGGRDIVRQYLNAGLVDELELDVSPVLIGEGLRLFEGIDPKRVGLTIEEAIHSPDVTHLRYTVKRL